MIKTIQNRDKNLMRLLYEQQFLTLDMVSKYYFAGSFRRASARVGKLVAMRLLKYEILALPGSPKTIRLGKKGIEFCRGSFPFSVTQNRKVSLSTLNHDAIVTEIRLSLRDRFDAEWVPEKAMRVHKLKKIPDGILLFQSGKRIALEVENTIKSKKRYDQMWGEWEQHDFLLILYVATTDSIYRALEKRMSEHKSDKVRFGLVRSKDLIEGKIDWVWTPRGQVPLFALRAF